MELETVIAELKQLRADFAELKNKFESLLGQAGWQWFKYNTAPAAAPAPWSGAQPLNYISCAKCGIFYSVGSVHFCMNQNPVIFNTNGTSQTVASGYAKDVAINLSGN